MNGNDRGTKGGNNKLAQQMIYSDLIFVFVSLGKKIPLLCFLEDDSNAAEESAFRPM